MQDHGVKGTSTIEPQKMCKLLINMAREIEELASKERDTFSPILKKWYPNAVSVSAVTLHKCYGALLKQQLISISPLMNETIIVLQRAGKLEKALLQMIADSSEERNKSLKKEMVSYEVETIILRLLKQWIQERLKIGKESLRRAKETEVSLLQRLCELFLIW